MHHGDDMGWEPFWNFTDYRNRGQKKIGRKGPYDQCQEGGRNQLTNLLRSEIHDSQGQNSDKCCLGRKPIEKFWNALEIGNDSRFRCNPQKRADLEYQNDSADSTHETRNNRVRDKGDIPS